MGIIKTLLVAATQQRGFRDGQAGDCISFEFCESFPQDSEPAKAYFKGYELGQKTASTRLVGNANKFVEKIIK